jgi:hypothetical protein
VILSQTPSQERSAEFDDHICGRIRARRAGQIVLERKITFVWYASCIRPHGDNQKVI